MKPSSLRAEPRPAPKMPDPSSSRTARSTASRALPPSSSTCQPARAATRQPSRCRPWSGGAMSNAPPWTAIAGVPLVDVMCPVSSPIGPVALRPWPVSARTTVPAVPPIVGSGQAGVRGGRRRLDEHSLREQVAHRVADLVIADLDDVAAGLADRGKDLARPRRPVDPDAFGDRRGGRHGDGVGLAGPEGASERRARIALDADQPREPLDHARRPQPAEAEVGAEEQRAATQGSDDGIGRPAPELLEDLVGEGRGAGQECRLPEVRGIGDLGAGVLERASRLLAGRRPGSRHGHDDGAVRPSLEQLGRRGVGRHEQRAGAARLAPHRRRTMRRRSRTSRRRSRARPGPAATRPSRWSHGP